MLVWQTTFTTMEISINNQSLAYSCYNCTYHLVFIPKYRRKVILGKLREKVIEILGKVRKTERFTIIKAVTFLDHVHIYVSIPSKDSVSKTVFQIKAKCKLLIFDRQLKYRGWYSRLFRVRRYY